MLNIVRNVGYVTNAENIDTLAIAKKYENIRIRIYNNANAHTQVDMYSGLFALLRPVRGTHLDSHRCYRNKCTYIAIA